MIEEGREWRPPMMERYKEQKKKNIYIHTNIHKEIKMETNKETK